MPALIAAADPPDTAELYGLLAGGLRLGPDTRTATAEAWGAHQHASRRPRARPGWRGMYVLRVSEGGLGTDVVEAAACTSDASAGGDGSLLRLVPVPPSSSASVRPRA